MTTVVGAGSTSDYSNIGIFVETARTKESQLINSFIEKLLSGLNQEKHPNRIRRLNDLQEGTSVLNATTMDEIEEASSSCGEAVRKVLVTLKGEKLGELRELTRDLEKPLFFKNIFNLAIIEKRLDKSMKQPQKDREPTIKKLSDDLVNVGNYGGAIAVWDCIPNHTKGAVTSEINYFKAESLASLSPALAEKGQDKEAFKVIEKIISTKNKRSALLALIPIFEDQGKSRALQKTRGMLAELELPPPEWY